MKKIILALALLTSVMSYASDPVVRDTTINKVTYSIYQGSRGGQYIIVISKTGKTYKKYFKTK